eukprot:GILI01004844.1.p1 GENE.GILI01004844.1~~GILI01004844.1.p1  ORF type:complete len:183 (-),score=22.89 GILI01004844.1:33-581(-)
MRFKFCGDQDAPDWILAEISVLSKISSIRMKLLCLQVLSHLCGGEMDMEKVKKLTSDTDTYEMEAAVAALRFILFNSGKFDVDDTILCKELQQLGLPKENSEALAKPYREKKDLLREKLAHATLSLPRVVESQCFGTSTNVEIKLSTDQGSLHTLSLNPSLASSLLEELLKARDVQDALDRE